MVCLRYAKNREEAEEILQEGFIRVFDFIHQFKFAGSFEGWMRKIMVNCALQKYRSKISLHPVINLDTSSIEQPDNEDILSGLGTKELLKMKQHLHRTYRMIFNLDVVESMKHRERAEFFGISEGTSKSNLSDARTILQRAVTNSLATTKKKVNSV